MTTQTLTLSSTVENEFAGHTLIAYLCKRFPYKTQLGWNESIIAHNVVVNDRICTSDQILKLKDRVSYTSERNEPSVATNIETIFEDDHILVVNKPSPLPVHSDGYFILNTLIHILRERTSNQELNLGHRLDRETTGILILSKKTNVTAKLMNEIENGDTKKLYLAVTRGRFDFEEKIIHGWLGPKPDSQIPMRQHLVSEKIEGYKESSTHFTLQQQLNGHSLLACELLSGRTNQIRVHLESIGHSIVGDKLYGRSDEEYLDYVKNFKKTGDMSGGGNWDHSRQLLHAWKLSINHPITNRRMQFEAPVANDMEKFLQERS